MTASVTNRVEIALIKISRDQKILASGRPTNYAREVCLWMASLVSKRASAIFSQAWYWIIVLVVFMAKVLKHFASFLYVVVWALSNNNKNNNDRFDHLSPLQRVMFFRGRESSISHEKKSRELFNGLTIFFSC